MNSLSYLQSTVWTTAACWLVAVSTGTADSPIADSPAQDSTARVEAAAGGPSSVSARQRELVRDAAQLRRATRQALMQEARSEGIESFQAAEDLVDVYIALRLDRSLTDAERQRLAGKVRSRLIRVRDDLVKRQQQGSQGRAGEDGEQRTASARLAERAALRAAEAVGRTAQQVLAQQGLAGPAGAVAGGAGAGGAMGAALPQGDYGQDLADLIQTVIAPSTWERSGGPGSIYYYRPLRVLVIRQTGEVHGQIGGVIEDLRQAGN